jgi:hypothetical protein
MADPRYRGQHTTIRARIQATIDAGVPVHCTNPTCLHPGTPISPTRNTPLSLQLGHEPDGVTHRGPEHRVCNETEGGKAGAAVIHGRRQHTTWDW